MPRHPAPPQTARVSPSAATPAPLNPLSRGQVLTWSSVPGFFHSACCFQGTSMLSSVSYNSFITWQTFWCQIKLHLEWNGHTVPVIHSVVQGPFGCFHQRLWLQPPWPPWPPCACVSPLLWEVCRGVELLGHITVCLTFKGITRLFCKVTVPFYIPIKSVCGLWFLRIFAHI